MLAVIDLQDIVMILLLWASTNSALDRTFLDFRESISQVLYRKVWRPYTQVARQMALTLV